MVTSLSFFQFMDRLEYSRCRITYAWSVILSFSLISFHLTKTENRTKISTKGFPTTIALSKGTILA